MQTGAGAGLQLESKNFWYESRQLFPSPLCSYPLATNALICKRIATNYKPAPLLFQKPDKNLVHEDIGGKEQMPTSSFTPEGKP